MFRCNATHKIETQQDQIAEPMNTKKSDLPEKLCVTCGRPFRWRKKWAKVWEEVKYCSERCRRESSSASRNESHGEKQIAPTQSPNDKTA